MYFYAADPEPAGTPTVIPNKHSTVYLSASNTEQYLYYYAQGLYLASQHPLGCTMRRASSKALHLWVATTKSLRIPLSQAGWIIKPSKSLPPRPATPVIRVSSLLKKGGNRGFECGDKGNRKLDNIHPTGEWAYSHLTACFHTGMGYSSTRRERTETLLRVNK